MMTVVDAGVKSDATIKASIRLVHYSIDIFNSLYCTQVKIFYYFNTSINIFNQLCVYKFKFPKFKA